jgi:hypothetical protein
MDNLDKKDRYKVTTPMPPIPELPMEESLLNLYDVDNPDINLFNALDEENIRLSGSKIYFYLYHGEENHDDIYLEERNKVITSQPITAFCNYDPKVIEENLSEYGLELTNDQVFVFNKTYIDNLLKRSPRPGDVIKPYFQNMYFDIFEVQEDSFESYGVYHYNCFAKLLRDAPDIQNEPNIETPKIPGGLSIFDLEGSN